MIKEYPKAIKRLIREQGAIAYEKELRRELEKLSASFDDWRAGSISGVELSDRVYAFTKGPSRELYNKYDNSVLDMTVAYAIVSGVLDKSEVPSELLEHLAGPIQFYEERE